MTPKAERIVMLGIIHWELTRLGRRRRLFVLRTVYGCLLGCMLCITYSANWDGAHWQAPYLTVANRLEAKIADQFFAALAFIQLTVAMIFAPAFAALAIAAEKESRTLLFVLSTPLSARQIVLAKWLARSIQALVPVVAGFGFVGIMQLFGGVGGDHLLYSTILTFGTVLTITAASVLASVFTRRALPAISTAYLFAFLVLFGVPLAGHVVVLYDGNPEVVELSSPLARALVALEPFHATSDLIEHGSTVGVWRLLLWEVFASAACLTLAVARLRPAALCEAHGSARTTQRRGARSPGGTPAIEWKDRWFTGGSHGPSARVLELLVLAVVVAVSMLPFYHLGWSANAAQHYRESLHLTTFLVFMVVPLLVLIRGALSIARERQQYTWESLLTTPLSASDILHGKRRAALRGPLLWGVILVGILYSVGTAAQVASCFQTAFLVALLWACADVLACTGLRCSLGAKNVVNAVVLALGSYTIAAWIFGSLMFGLLSMSRDPSEWVVCMLVFSSIALCVVAYGRLLLADAINEFGALAGRIDDARPTAMLPTPGTRGNRRHSKV